MKNSKTIAIVGNGTLSTSLIKKINHADVIIGVDYAAYWLLIQGIVPDVAIGDFDSVTTEQLAEIKEKVKTVTSFSPEKDFTDMELAIEYAATMQPANIQIFGGVGSRLDHSVGNLLLLSRYTDAPFSMHILNDTNDCQVINKDLTLQKSEIFRYVSLLSLSPESLVSLRGFKYEIQNYSLWQGQTVGISNELKEQFGTIVVHKGVLLIIQSRD